jgi:hypothetical protein
MFQTDLIGGILIQEGFHVVNCAESTSYTCRITIPKLTINQ